MSFLAEKLGLAPQTRVLIVSCDDLGFSHAANVAVYDSLRRGVATSASLMIPAPWARAAVSAYRGEDVGVHLTLNAEHELYRWGPITHSPSLFDGDGGFPRTIEDVWEHADLDEVRHEWRAQVDRSILWGFDVTHLDSHLGGVELKPEFFDVFLELADDLRLPVRLPASEEERRVGFPFRQLAAERGVVAPDRVLPISVFTGTRTDLDLVPPGVTEVRGTPALDTPELRASAVDWPARVADGARLGPDGPLAQLLESGGVERIGYRALRQLMR
jgi:hypothetical protein